MENTLELYSLTKRYVSRKISKKALADVSFTLGRAFTAFWGPVVTPLGNLLDNALEACRKLPDSSYINVKILNSVYTRSGQNSTPNSNATNLHSSQKRCCSFCISSSNASPTFQVQKSIFHQMTKPIQVTVILPLLLAISFSRNDDIHSSISGISNDLIGVIPTIGQ